ncbi:NAD(P)H-dependent oxidoreductase [Streptomyces graminilatus]|uniref:NAD(P)H-dependent oxidoreductase n=1 Tax=Streptomyces graminilatus TaxID=1464070 RepID=UPI0006E465F6|nr:NAD(P)H-dependent oxidoreductase [Streptomyces graminilatus]
MNVLIVFAHPELCSFNGALKVRAVDVLKRAGHEVVVSDLYRLGWKSAVDADDFPGDWTDPDFLDVPAEQERVSATHETPPDVRAEQEKVARCDLLILQFPLWWSGMPAILKGWVDRTMARGFAYTEGRAYDTGPLKGRRALVCTTTGTPSGLYDPHGTDDDVDRALWPIHQGVLRCLGFEVLPAFVARAPGEASAKQRVQYLAEYAERLLALTR